MGFTLLDGPVVSTVGDLLEFQGTKPLSRSIVLAQTVSSLPLEPYDAVHNLKKPHETGQVYQAAGSQGLILSSLQILNSCNIKLMLCQSMNFYLNDNFHI